jgi:hypothetical protein
MDTTNAIVERTSAPANTPSPVRTADDLAAAFLLGYGRATGTAYGNDLRVWGPGWPSIGSRLSKPTVPMSSFGHVGWRPTAWPHPRSRDGHRP